MEKRLKDGENHRVHFYESLCCYAGNRDFLEMCIRDSEYAVECHQAQGRFSAFRRAKALQTPMTSLQAVSYTHLDVYKRQVVEWALLC